MSEARQSLLPFQWILGLFVVVALAACARPGSSGGSAKPDDGAASSSTALALVSFERWLRLEAGVEPADIAPEARVELWREYCAEGLFAEAAKRENLSVPENSLAAEVARLEALGDVWPPEQRREAARQKLLAVLYEERVLRGPIQVTEDEVAAALKNAGVEEKEGVSFRMLRTETRTQLDQARARIVKGEAFDQVAREVSTTPDRGALQQQFLSDLPKSAAAVMQGLGEGTVSEPVEIGKAWYLFLLEARNRDLDPNRARQRAALRQSLLQQKFDQRRARELESLAQAAKLNLAQPPAAAPEKP